jgi:broad specificity phosphatase PhoE
MNNNPIAYVLRHGQTKINAEGRYRSWSDPPLDEIGISQAKAAAAFLKGKDIEHIICSPLLRAFVTADICSQGVKVFQSRGLFPWRLGIFTGLPKDEHNEALRLFVDNPSVCIPEGECLNDFEDRQFAFWDAALKMARTAGTTLYVAHTSNVTALVNMTEGAPETEPEFGDSVKPGGVAAIYFDGGKHRVEVVFGHEEAAVFGGS